MDKKIRLPFHELEHKFPTIISSEELRSILGGSYGYDPSSWGSSSDSFLNNVGDMMNNGMFNFSGGGSSFNAEFDVSNFSSDSTGSGSASNFTMPSLFGSTTSGNNAWSFGTSSSSTNMFTFGSANTSGSNAVPGPLVGNFNGFTTEFSMPGAANPTLKFKKADGSSFSIGYSNGKLTLSIGL